MLRFLMCKKYCLASSASKLDFLSPTINFAWYHICCVYFQIQNWLGNNYLATDCVWRKSHVGLRPVYATNSMNKITLDVWALWWPMRNCFETVIPEDLESKEIGYEVGTERGKMWAMRTLRRPEWHEQRKGKDLRLSLYNTNK